MLPLNDKESENRFSLNEKKWDSKLNIFTQTSDYAEEQDDCYGYDPTPYIVLEKLLNQNLIKNSDTVIDYGCGKGRVSFFLHNQTHCKVIGIDHSKRFIKKALKKPQKPRPY